MKWLAIYLLLSVSGAVHGKTAEPATKDDLKQLLQHLDKRFEQIDKRFEQIDKRFKDQRTFMLTIISIFTAIIGAMFYYMVARFNRHEEKIAQIVDRSQNLEKIIFAVRTDPVLRKELREALKVH
jgi:glutathione S-transferase